MNEKIPDAMPEGFGEDVEVDASSPHPNKKCKHTHLLQEWMSMREELGPMILAQAMIPLDQRDMAIMAAALSTLVADVKNEMVAFGHFGDERDREVEAAVKKQCLDTLKKILPLADPRSLPGSEYMNEGGSDE